MRLTVAGIDLSDILAARKRAVAGALNLLENRGSGAAGPTAELIAALTRCARPKRHLVGVTGPPGSGKSTLLSRLIREYRSAGRRVGVITVDPSSPRSGGALLGDRARIDCDPGDPGLFIRSMAAGPLLAAPSTVGFFQNWSRGAATACRVLSHIANVNCFSPRVAAAGMAR